MTVNEARNRVLDICWVASNVGTTRGRASLKWDEAKVDETNKKLDHLFVQLIDRLNDWMGAKRNDKG